MIQTMETKKPIEQRAIRAVGWLPLSAKTATNVPSMEPEKSVTTGNQIFDVE